MESYPEVRKSLNSFLANIVHDMAIERTHIKDAQTVQVEGTSYEEINANQSVRFDLKEYETEIQVHNDDIRTLDFSILRNRIYEAAKKEAKEMNKDFLNMLSSQGLSIDAKNGSAIDAILSLMKMYKKKGFNLDSLKIISSKEMYAKFQKEMENPLNQEKYYREWNRIKNENG
jgi:hypothetical protein